MRSCDAVLALVGVSSRKSVLRTLVENRMLVRVGYKPVYELLLDAESTPTGEARSAEDVLGRRSVPVGHSPRSTALDPGYWWELSMRQVEVLCRTLVLDDPRRARRSSKPWLMT